MDTNKKDRIIYHIDCNGFYASVEESQKPELRKVPMAVCGSPENRRGIILAKNERAKQCNIQTAETVWQAKKKCPELVLVPPQHHLYREYCERINQIYEQYTARVERFSIDESFLDVTGSLHLFDMDEMQLAHTIRKHIPRELGVTVSVGVSFNKIFAKLASDMKKPNAVTRIGREDFKQILWPLPVSNMLNVGKNTRKTLHGMGIHTIGDLANASENILSAKLGKSGEQLHDYANGIDPSEVAYLDEQEPPKSVGNGKTFKRNLITREDIQTAITALADTVASRLRKKNLKCTGVQVSIRDKHFKTITRQKQLDYPTYVAADLVSESMELIGAAWKIGIPIRMLAISAQNLVPANTAPQQLSFFQGAEQMKDRKKQEDLEKALDTVRERYGRNSVFHGSIMSNDLGLKKDDKRAKQ